MPKAYTALATLQSISEMAQAMEKIHEALIGDGCFLQTDDWVKYAEMMTDEIEEIKSRDTDEMDQDDIYESLCDGGYSFPNTIDDMTKVDILEHLKMNESLDVAKMEKEIAELKEGDHNFPDPVDAISEYEWELPEAVKYPAQNEMCDNVMGICDSWESVDRLIRHYETENAELKEQLAVQSYAPADLVTKKLLEAIDMENAKIKEQMRHIGSLCLNLAGPTVPKKITQNPTEHAKQLVSK
jgi:hypothetical protein